jgi:hypothetical protein
MSTLVSGTPVDAVGKDVHALGGAACDRDFVRVRPDEGRETRAHVFAFFFQVVVDGVCRAAITGSVTERAYLGRDAYLALGVRQSIYAPDIRGAVYDLFEKYLRFLAEHGWFDPNILSHAWMARVEPRYDFVVVDEVQDLTNIQLLLILRALRDARGFRLCGDSNQIVHPNFFSWAKVKTLFWKERGEGEG